MSAMRNGLARLRLAFDRFGHAVARRIGGGWWRVRRLELAIYPRLGVPAFARWFYNGGSHGRGVPFYRRQEGDRRQRLRGLEAFARCIEAKHVVGVVACAAVPAAALLLEQWVFAGLLAVANLVGHGYPIMSMRWVRARAASLLARQERVGTPVGSTRRLGSTSRDVAALSGPTSEP
jgi:hypothetical protein